MTGVAGDGATRIHTRTNATNLTVRTNDTVTRPEASTFFAFLPRGTHHGDARNVDAKTIRIANFARSADEFATITFRNARSLVTHFAGIAKIAFVGRTITIVIEAIAFFGRWLIRLHTRQRSALTLHRSIRANAGFARITRSSATRASDSRDERREVVEIIVSTGQQIFPAEVERILRRSAVVNEQVNVWIGLIAIRIVLFLAVKDVQVVSRRRTIGHAFVKPNLAACITRVVLDIERLYRAHTIGTREEFVQVCLVRRLPRDVVPTKRILIPRVALQYGERQTTRWNERFGRRRRLRKRVDVFAATRKLTLQTIAHRNRRSVGLLERQGLAGSNCRDGEDGEDERGDSFAHSPMLERGMRHHKRSLEQSISWTCQSRKRRGRRF